MRLADELEAFATMTGHVLFDTDLATIRRAVEALRRMEKAREMLTNGLRIGTDSEWDEGWGACAYDVLPLLDERPIAAKEGA